MDAAGTIGGTVVDPQGDGVPGAVVFLGGDSPPHPDIAAVTDARGSFRFGGLGPGRYTVVVNAAGYATGTGQVAVDQDPGSLVIALAPTGRA